MPADHDAVQNTQSAKIESEHNDCTPVLPDMSSLKRTFSQTDHNVISIYSPDSNFFLIADSMSNGSLVAAYPRLPDILEETNVADLNSVVPFESNHVGLPLKVGQPRRTESRISELSYESSIELSGDSDASDTVLTVEEYSPCLSVVSSVTDIQSLDALSSNHAVLSSFFINRKSLEPKTKPLKLNKIDTTMFWSEIQNKNKAGNALQTKGHFNILTCPDSPDQEKDFFNDEFGTHNIPEPIIEEKETEVVSDVELKPAVSYQSRSHTHTASFPSALYNRKRKYPKRYISNAQRNRQKQRALYEIEKKRIENTLIIASGSRFPRTAPPKKYYYEIDKTQEKSQNTFLIRPPISIDLHDGINSGNLAYHLSLTPRNDLRQHPLFLKSTSAPIPIVSPKKNNKEILKTAISTQCASKYYTTPNRDPVVMEAHGAILRNRGADAFRNVENIVKAVSESRCSYENFNSNTLVQCVSERIKFEKTRLESLAKDQQLNFQNTDKNQSSQAALNRIIELNTNDTKEESDIESEAEYISDSDLENEENGPIYMPSSGNKNKCKKPSEPIKVTGFSKDENKTDFEKLAEKWIGKAITLTKDCRRYNTMKSSRSKLTSVTGEFSLGKFNCSGKVGDRPYNIESIYKNRQQTFNVLANPDDRPIDAIVSVISDLPNKLTKPKPKPIKRKLRKIIADLFRFKKRTVTVPSNTKSATTPFYKHQRRNCHKFGVNQQYYMLSNGDFVDLSKVKIIESEDMILHSVLEASKLLEHMKYTRTPKAAVDHFKNHPATLIDILRTPKGQLSEEERITFAALAVMYRIYGFTILEVFDRKKYTTKPLQTSTSFVAKRYRIEPSRTVRFKKQDQEDSALGYFPKEACKIAQVYRNLVRKYGVRKVLEGTYPIFTSYNSAESIVKSCSRK